MTRVRWLGHACFLIEAERRIIIDPWISGNPKCPVKLEELPRIDHILVTHDHGDHLGDAIDIARRDEAKVIAIYELAEHLRNLGVKNTVGANIGGEFTVDDISYVLTPALHSCERGSPVGFIIRLRNGFRIYHAGDTGVFSEMELIGKLYKIDLALLPIGGHYTMGPREAAVAITMLRPRFVIPMHYGTFPPIEVDPDRFRALVRELMPEVEVRILRPGEVAEF